MSSAVRPVGGYVQDASSFAPVAGVAIAIYHGTQTWTTSTTNSNGFWLVMGMPTGWAYSLAFSKSGYEYVTAQTGTIPPGTGRYEVDVVYMSKTTGVVEERKSKFAFDEVLFPASFSGPNQTVVVPFKVRNVGTGEGKPMVWVLFEGKEVAPPSATGPTLKVNEVWNSQYAFSTGLSPPAEAVMEIFVGANKENMDDHRIGTTIYAGDEFHPAHYFEITRVVAPTAELDAGSIVKITAYVKNVISGAETVKGEAVLQTMTEVFQRKEFEAYGGQEKAVAFDDMKFNSTTQLLVVVRRDGEKEAEFKFTIYIKSAPVKVTVGGAVDAPAGAIIDATVKVNGISAKYTYSNQYTCTVDKKPQYTITATKTGYKNYSATITDDGRNAYTHDIDMWPVDVPPPVQCPAGTHWDEAQQKCVSDSVIPEGKGSIQGIAVNSADNTAVADALVRLNTGQAAYTSETGNFSFANLDPGDYTVYGSAAMGRVSLDGTKIINPLQSLSVAPVQVMVEADRVTKVTLIYSPAEINPLWVAAGVAGAASIIAAVVATRAPPRKRRAPRKPVHLNNKKAR